MEDRRGTEEEECGAGSDNNNNNNNSSSVAVKDDRTSQQQRYEFDFNDSGDTIGKLMDILQKFDLNLSQQFKVCQSMPTNQQQPSLSSSPSTYCHNHDNCSITKRRKPCEVEERTDRTTFVARC